MNHKGVIVFYVLLLISVIWSLYSSIVVTCRLILMRVKVCYACVHVTGIFRHQNRPKHASILAPSALDLSAFGASWPPKRNVWIRHCPTNHSSSQKTRLNDLSHDIKIWTDLSSILSQSTRLTDTRTDRRTEFSSLDRVCIPCSAVKQTWNHA